MANASETQAGDGLVVPEKIPGDDLKPENIHSAADALDTVASSFNTTADDVDTAWSAMPASFVAPGAEVVYAGMTKPTQSARDFSAKVGKVTAALRTYADSLGDVKKTLAAIKKDAEAFLTEFDAEHRVWMNARDTKEYEWDASAGAGSASTTARFGSMTGGQDPVAYLKGKGETARAHGGVTQIRVHWSQSGDHVDRNNALLDRIADAYAKVNALEVECANTINTQRDDCVASLTAVQAWQLKQGGESAVDLPWGRKTEEDGNCSESFVHGIGKAGIETLQGVGGLFGYNPVTGQLGDGEHALQSWGGMLKGIGSVALMTSAVAPLAPILGDLGVPVFKDAKDTVDQMGKGLLAWDDWSKNPAEAAGKVVFNVGTMFIPYVDVLKGVSVLSKVEIVATAISKVDRIAGDLKDLFPGGKVPHVDLPDGGVHTPGVHVPDGHTKLVDVPHLPDEHLPDGLTPHANSGEPPAHVPEQQVPARAPEEHAPADSTPSGGHQPTGAAPRGGGGESPAPHATQDRSDGPMPGAGSPSVHDVDGPVSRGMQNSDVPDGHAPGLSDAHLYIDESSAVDRTAGPQETVAPSNDGLHDSGQYWAAGHSLSGDHYVSGFGADAGVAPNGQLSIEPPRADLSIVWGNDNGYVDVSSVLSAKTPVPQQGWPDLNSVNFQTVPDSQLFWTGRTEMPNPAGAPFVGSSDLASGLAQQRGGVTLETYLVEHGIKMPRWSGDPEVQKIWGDISRQYAESARGVVRVVLGRNVRPDAVWLTYEFDALKANPHVTQIVAVDPATGGMRTLFSRGE